MIRFVSINEIQNTFEYIQQYVYCKQIYFKEKIKLKTEEELKKSATDWLNPQARSGSERLAWCIYDEDRIVGLFDGSFRTKEYKEEHPEKKHNINIGIWIIPEYRAKGLGAKAFEHLKSEFEKSGIIKNISHYLCSSESIPDNQLIEEIGGVLYLKKFEYFLEYEDIAWDVIKSWGDDNILQENEIEVLQFQECPEDLLESYLKLFNEVKAQGASRLLHGPYVETAESRRAEEKNAKKHGYKRYTMVTREKDGTLSGMTEVFTNVFKEIPGAVAQELTGVIEKYRGRGLAKLLKARMLMFINEKYDSIDRFATINWKRFPNTDIQKAILSINKKMGYKIRDEINYYRFSL